MIGTDSPVFNIYASFMERASPLTKGLAAAKILASQACEMIFDFRLFNASFIEDGTPIYELNSLVGDSASEEIDALARFQASCQIARKARLNEFNDPSVVHPNFYPSRRRAITAGMTYKFQRVLLVWCTTEFVRPDFVATVLGKYDKTVEVRDKWIPTDASSGRKVWGGAVAVFNSEVYAMLASRQLKRQSELVKTTMFPEFLQFIVETEIRQPLYGAALTRLLIRGRRSFPPRCLIHVEMMLHGLGNVEFSRFIEGVEDYGVICEVDYAFATHAFAAKTIVNGKFFKATGTLAVEMLETPKEKAIAAKIETYLKYFENRD